MINIDAWIACSDFATAKSEDNDISRKPNKYDFDKFMRSVYAKSLNVDEALLFKGAVDVSTNEVLPRSKTNSIKSRKSNHSDNSSIKSEIQPSSFQYAKSLNQDEAKVFKDAVDVSTELLIPWSKTKSIKSRKSNQSDNSSIKSEIQPSSFRSNKSPCSQRSSNKTPIFYSGLIAYCYHCKQLSENFNYCDVCNNKLPTQPIQKRKSIPINGKEPVSMKKLKIKSQNSSTNIAIAKESSVENRILRNGNYLPPVIINGQHTDISNTCAFDSILNLFSNGIIESSIFRSYMEGYKNENCSFGFARTVLIHALQDQNCNEDENVYTNRGKLLSLLFPRINGVVDSYTNVSSLCSKLMKAYDNIEQTIECKCRNYRVSRENMVTISLNIQVVWDNYQTLSSEITDYFTQYTSSIYCEGCKKASGIRRFRIGNYLWIETEDAYNVDIHFKTQLNCIPKTLMVCNRKFMLIGLAEYKPGHYTCHCLNKKGEWVNFDDQKNDVKETKDTDLIQIAALFYVRSE